MSYSLDLLEIRRIPLDLTVGGTWSRQISELDKSVPRELDKRVPRESGLCNGIPGRRQPVRPLAARPAASLPLVSLALAVYRVSPSD